MIECENVSKQYKAKAVITDFNYSFENKLYYLKGKNGSGKSTLFRMITGIEKVTSGRISNNAKQVLFLTDSGVGQKFLTIQENIELAYAMYGISLTAQIKEDIKQLYSEEQLKTLYEKASLGMSLKVGCTLLFKMDFWDLIIIDETLSNIDIESENILIKQIEQLVDNDGTCVIVTSHNDLFGRYKLNYSTIEI
ncbi:ATP-binding cassette domain-containing protein [Staphylococcus simulans]|uniref:ATP-binding cassette domain-containing protein n=1 Tax=Staphylococcus simulans TaxID=1286 RepID=UPI001E5F83F0|nr:ATP-binding cassette domain-containing protein [Staphylococcus simulans]MCD8915291.1 ATP-binding cassette domain-containing protein [Staphylococcus simulans]